MNIFVAFPMLGAAGCVLLLWMLLVDVRSQLRATERERDWLAGHATWTVSEEERGSGASRYAEQGVADTRHPNFRHGTYVAGGIKELRLAAAEEAVKSDD